MDMNIHDIARKTIEKQRAVWATGGRAQFYKWANWTVDALFYNVQCVPPELWDRCTYEKIPEQSIIVLERKPDRSHPSGRTFRLEEYRPVAIDSMNKTGICALVIAGVGSSALGTVTLAADVADAIGGHVRVAGIVTGEGRRDLVRQGMEGWFVMRVANQWYQLAEGVLDQLKIVVSRSLGLPTRAIDELFGTLLEVERNFVPEESTEIVRLIATAPDLKLVVAHSKGGLYLSSALYSLLDQHREFAAKVAKELTFVTLGAVIYPPELFCDSVRQFIGELDVFGEMNSRQHIEKTVIPGVMHYLNACVPFHMNCQKVLRSHFAPLLASLATPVKEELAK